MPLVRLGLAIRTTLVLGLLLNVHPSGFAAPRDREWLVRVGLERQAMGREIFVQSKGGAFRWVDVDTGRTLAESPSEQLWRVVADGNGLLAEPVAPSPAPTSPKKENIPIRGQRLRAEPVGNALLMVGAERARLKLFRGAMEWQRFRLSPQRGDAILLTINWVRLDDYLKAVLPVEIPPRFHPEALKAQAVAARSFTFRRLNRHRERGY
ncbi:MAG: SpoIID/LytB domain-containing protein, partial [Fimbriimonadales bacterium]|nr:SpoIID/LytB domain-containing protein [Fimbriimonadales bacterium]